MTARNTPLTDGSLLAGSPLVVGAIGVLAKQGSGGPRCGDQRDPMTAYEYVEQIEAALGVSPRVDLEPREGHRVGADDRRSQDDRATAFFESSEGK